LVYPEGSEATLYTVAADGSDRRALTTIHAEYPDWSPDGSTIAFDDGRNIHGSPLIVPNGHIFTVRADGTGLTQITRGNGGEFSPSWSPDGTHLAITAKEPGLPAGISILDLATGNMEPITTSPYRGYWDAAPDYSPDGQQIAFIRVRQLIEKGSTRDLTALFVVDVDGSDLRRLTPWTMNAGLPSWSPDGSRIAFNSRDHSIAPGSGDAQIFTIRPDGTDLTRLTAETNAASFWPSWSPDGARIVFTRYVFAPESQAFRLYTMKADGSRAAPLTEQTILDVNQADWGQHP
jgi:Tol biopolymer transport system component